MFACFSSMLTYFMSPATQAPMSDQLELPITSKPQACQFKTTSRPDTPPEARRVAAQAGQG